VRSPRTAALAACALVGFAANSLLCRAAIGGGEIDGVTFTAIRIAAGAATLVALCGAGRLRWRGTGSWVSAGALFAYAALFSFAYLRLTAATGALVLFAAVQATMIGWAIARGTRPRPGEWLGLAIAGGGVVVLAAPGLAAPDPLGGALMAAAGASWGIYSLRGRTGRGRPLAATADNFARAVPLAAGLLIVVAVLGFHASLRGVALAAASGALASGVGYSLWYAALPRLSAQRAAIIQLAVPALAAGGGVVMLGEPFAPRLAIASAAILGGILVALLARARR
jgi:drug/metabolite transporter (DMT)-like permease